LKFLILQHPRKTKKLRLKMIDLFGLCTKHHDVVNTHVTCILTGKGW
jgi:hypothetical protein